jgi:transcriptional antiterminator
MNVKTLRLLLFLMIFAGCSPASMQDFRQEGQSVQRALIRDLARVRNREQLLHIQGRLKRRFNKLVKIMIDAKKWQDSHPLSEVSPMTKKDLALSESLRQQLVRVYGIEGCKEIIEGAQADALATLDLFNQRRLKLQSEPAPGH